MDKYAVRLALEADRALRESRPKTASPVLSCRDLLETVCAQLPKESLLTASLVSKSFRDACWAELLRTVELDNNRAMSSFLDLLTTTDEGRRVQGLSINKCCLPYLELLPSLTPNLTTLTLTSSTRLSHDVIASLLPQWPRLQHVTIIGQSLRTRRRRLSEMEREGEIGKALRRLGEAGGLNLVSLRVHATPLKVSSLDYFLERCGEGLETLVIDGCTVGPQLHELASRWCPRLKDCRLDMLSSKKAPPGTPRPYGEPYAFDLHRSLVLPSSLRSLHLSCLPGMDPSTFAIFSTPHHSSLQSISFSHCPITAQHLSHFTRITRLRIVDCPAVHSVPVFPASSDERGVVGSGCKELRYLSLLGCSGLTLGNLWELVMLGHEEIGDEERRTRQQMGLGQRGIKKITIDGAENHDHIVTLNGSLFNVPSTFGAAPEVPSVATSLPSSLSPPPQLLPYLNTNILSPELPSQTLLQTLLASRDLEEIGIFGKLDPPFSRARPPNPKLSWWNLAQIQAASLLVSVLLQTPVVNTFLHPPDMSWGARPPIPAFEMKSEEATRVWPASPRPQKELGEEVGKRLSDEQVEWLLRFSEGSLQKVLV